MILFWAMVSDLPDYKHCVTKTKLAPADNKTKTKIYLECVSWSAGGWLGANTDNTAQQEVAQKKEVEKEYRLQSIDTIRSGTSC